MKRHHYLGLCTLCAAISSGAFMYMGASWLGSIIGPFFVGWFGTATLHAWWDHHEHS